MEDGAFSCKHCPFQVLQAFDKAFSLKFEPVTLGSY
jgi:hypothetical protein